MTGLEAGPAPSRQERLPDRLKSCAVAVCRGHEPSGRLSLAKGTRQTGSSPRALRGERSRWANSLSTAARCDCLMLQDSAILSGNACDSTSVSVEVEVEEGHGGGRPPDRIGRVATTDQEIVYLCQETCPTRGCERNFAPCTDYASCDRTHLAGRNLDSYEAKYHQHLRSPLGPGPAPLKATTIREPIVGLHSCALALEQSTDLKASLKKGSSCLQASNACSYDEEQRFFLHRPQVEALFKFLS